MELFTSHTHYRVTDNEPPPLVQLGDVVDGGAGQRLAIRFGPPDNYVLISGPRVEVLGWLKELVLEVARVSQEDAAAVMNEAKRRLEVIR